MAEDVVPVMWYVACCSVRPCRSMPLVGLVVGSNMLFLSQLLLLTTFVLSLHFHAGAVTVRAGDRAHQPKGARQPHCSIWRVSCCRFTDNRCVFARFRRRRHRCCCWCCCYCRGTTTGNNSHNPTAQQPRPQHRRDTTAAIAATTTATTTPANNLKMPTKTKQEAVLHAPALSPAM